MKDDGFSHPLDVLADGHLDRLAELQGRKGLPLIKACAKWMATRPPFNGATDSASVVQYKPCEICTTQSWCETHGCQCYPVSAVQPERCCLDYPRCDCNSPPEPDNEWHCSQYPGCECFAGCREKALEVPL